MTRASTLSAAIGALPEFSLFGTVSAVVGLMVEAKGLGRGAGVGGECRLIDRHGRAIAGEVVGFRAETALIMPAGALAGIGPGCRVELVGDEAFVCPDRRWLGRVIDAFGEPIDGLGPLPLGPARFPLCRPPPRAHARRKVGAKIDLGVRAIDAFLTCCRGQRMGIFAGSGVGKSTLMAMMARHTQADVIVIGLIGERGREAREFVEDDLGACGLKRSVVVVATSDEAPAVRRRAAFATMATAEFFRDQGLNVLCLMDSVTRFAMAQREIGLAAGEPPTTKGYTPSVFAELPRLLERAGPGAAGQGDITGLFTVLVEGDDHNEPVADAVRGILDGHIVLDRAIGERGRWPAINILRSVSRTLPGCNAPTENALIADARRALATYEDMAELIRLGAYKRGSDAAVDRAIELQPALDAFLTQSKAERSRLAEVYPALAAILGAETPAAAASAPQPAKPARPGRAGQRP